LKQRNEITDNELDGNKKSATESEEEGEIKRTKSN
jgi:hypothetical protein